MSQFQLKQHSAPPTRWHRVYYVLAVVDLLTIVICLTLGHMTRMEYESSVAVNKTWAATIAQFTDLSQGATLVNAPGNEVFLSRDPNKQLQQLLSAHDAFRNQLLETRSSIAAIPPSAESQTGLGRERIQAALDDIEVQEAEMNAQAIAVLSEFANGDEQSAARKMAAMDRQLGFIQDRLAFLVHTAQSQQKRVLEEQLRGTSVFRTLEIIISIAVCLIIGGALWYGNSLGRRFLSTQRKSQGLESFLFSSIEFAPNGVLIVDRHGTIRHVNQALARTFGYLPEQMVDQPLSLLIEADTQNFHAELVTAFFRDPLQRPMGESLGDVRGVRQDGAIVFVEVGLAPIEFAGDMLALATVIDVTPRKALEEQNARHARLLQALTDAQERFIAGVDPKELLSNVLAYALELTGSELGFIAETVYEKAGTPVLQIHAITNFEFVPEAEQFYVEHAPADMKFRNLSTLFGQAVTRAEVIISNDVKNDPRATGIPAGHPCLDNFLGIPFKRGANVVGVLCLANAPSGYTKADTEPLAPFLTTCATFLEGWRAQREKLEADIELRDSLFHLAEAQAKLERNAIELEFKANELEKERAKAESANRAKSDFLANMSHEIRTPMTAILGYADLCLEDNSDMSPESRDEVFRTIRRNGQHLLELINDILDLSKIEAGGMTVEEITVDPFEVMRDVEQLMRARADVKGLSLRFALAGPIPARITTDPTRLRQILVNLVGNAVKFTSAGGIKVTIRFLHDDPKLLAFDVTDTGIGMSEEQSAALFRPFSQADTSTTRNFGGTGLGLTISRQLARRLGGDVTIHATAPGKGTTFRASIAVGPAAETAEFVTSPNSKSKKKQAGIAHSKLPPGTRILLAEDSPDSQRLIEFVLKKAGACVTVVENGQEAHEKALAQVREGSPFDVILMDMQMPVMDGIEATAALRADGYDLPIIALTANGMASEIRKFVEAGCDEYALKPIDRTLLFAAITRHVQDTQDSTNPILSWHT